MFASTTLRVTLLFLLTFQLCGVSAKPTYSLAGKRSPSRAAFFKSKSLELEHSTNGKRMAAGLSPHTPTRPFNPSRVVARDPQASPILYPGVILSRDASTGTPIGYMSKSFVGGKMKVTTVEADALRLSLSFSSSTELLGLRIMDDSPTWPWVAVQGSPLSGPTITSVIPFMRSNMVPPGSPPAVAGTSSAGTGATATHVFKFNPATNEITATWVNPNLSVFDAYFYVSTAAGTKSYYLGTNPNLSANQGVLRVRLYLQG